MDVRTYPNYRRLAALYIYYKMFTKIPFESVSTLPTEIQATFSSTGWDIHIELIWSCFHIPVNFKLF